MRLLLLVLSGCLLVSATRNWRRIVAVSIVCSLTLMPVGPPPAQAQSNIFSAIQAVLNVINGIVAQMLSAINSIVSAIRNLYEQVVWPVQLINQARALVSGIIAQFRGRMQNIFYASVSSAQLPNPVALESIIRDRQTGNISGVTPAYLTTYRPVPGVNDADPVDRDMIDMDDAMAMNNLKTLKAADRAGDLILEAANHIEDEAAGAAPGSAPFLTATAMAANIQSQAVMQKMIAALMRQEAARLAHQNTLRKRAGIMAGQVRGDVTNILRRR